jgi:hypothetical protein
MLSRLTAAAVVVATIRTLAVGRPLGQRIAGGESQEEQCGRHACDPRVRAQAQI